MSEIKINGARVHNLKNINVSIPKNSLTVVTGLSGSGKSSLAFDTIYAEGQRRYVESLSSYARQFLARHDKPDVDSIEGLSPAIAISQKASNSNPRSTVGTITEIYDFLRVLFTAVGTPYCPQCKLELKRDSVSSIISNISRQMRGEEIIIFSPVASNSPKNCSLILRQLKNSRYSQVRLNGSIYSIDQALSKINSLKTCQLDIVIGHLKINQGSGNTINKTKNQTKLINTDRKLTEMITAALDLSNGYLAIYKLKANQDYFFSKHYICPNCRFTLEKMESRMFSFNSPHGACASCKGLGTKIDLDPDLLVPNKKLTIAEGAIRPWSRLNGNASLKKIEQLGKKYDFSINIPWQKLSSAQKEIILNGDGSRSAYPGIINDLLSKYNQTDSSYIRTEISKYIRQQKCPQCKGQRLNPSSLNVFINNNNISDVSQMNIGATKNFLTQLKLNPTSQKIATPIITEIISRLDFLTNVGLGYLTLDRSADTLSGGESQRTRLVTQIGSGLSGVIYILDEPSIGLHQKDNHKLIKTLGNLKKLGNTVIVVEHDQSTIEAADWVIDVGPGAGKHGGEIVAEGKPKQITVAKNSITAAYVSGRKTIPAPSKYRCGSGKSIEIIGASEFNLRNIDVKIPLGKLVCVTGVSGSGKSTLVTDILSRALARKFYRSKDIPGRHKQIKGLENINKVVTIDQSPIGRTPRSNPATYTGIFTHIRDLYSQVPEAKIKGLNPGYFSFNVKGGRCETCQGDGVIKVEMNFLPDVYVDCEECHGQRYQKQVLEIFWNEKNIADVLSMTVEEALSFFKTIPALKQKLSILDQVGLGYIELGQSATTLSGGEAQRIKLATELSRRATGRTFYILDEPTTGLHFEDIKKLLNVLNCLIDKGNTVLVIEHNLDVIKCADWVIDLGPGGGDKGGHIVAAGTPKQVAKVTASHTGQFLKKVLN